PEVMLAWHGGFAVVRGCPEVGSWEAGPKPFRLVLAPLRPALSAAVPNRDWRVLEKHVATRCPLLLRPEGARDERVGRWSCPFGISVRRQYVEQSIFSYRSGSRIDCIDLWFCRMQ